MTILSHKELIRLYKEGKLTDTQIEETFGPFVLKELKNCLQTNYYMGSYYAL